MFINASTKEFTFVNNAIPSYDISFEHLLYYKIPPLILRSAHKDELISPQNIVVLPTRIQRFHAPIYITSKSNTCVSLIIMKPYTSLHFCNLK